MSVNKTKKIILKSYKKTTNKYIGTDDQIEEKIILDNNKGNLDKQKVNQISEAIDLNLIGQKKDMNDLIEKLNLLKSEYESEKIEGMENVKMLNNQINEKNKELKIITKENMKLISILKDMGKNLKGEFLKLYNEKMKKKLKSIKNQESLKYDIIIREEEIKNAKKFVDIEKKQSQRYQRLLNEVNNGMEDSMANELKELNDNIKQLNEDILELSIFKSGHKYCKKIIQNLKNKSNLYQTEIEFESKKNNMLDNKKTYSQNKQNISYTESNKNLFKGPCNESFASKINYSQHIRQEVLNKSIPKPEKLNISTYRYINNKINLISKTPSKKEIYLNIPNDNKTVLFTEKEYDFLQEIIPSKYINRYIDLYESRRKEKEEIKNKYEENNSIKDEKQQIQLKIDFIDVKLKEEEKRHLELLLKFRNNNRKKEEIKLKIKNYEEEIKKYKKFIERKDKMNRIIIANKNKNEIIY